MEVLRTEIQSIKKSLTYHEKLLENILEILDSRSHQADAAKKSFEDQMASMIGSPLIQNNPMLKGMMAQIFKTPNDKEGADRCLNIIRHGKTE